jgi:hypothetical protein
MSACESELYLEWNGAATGHPVCAITLVNCLDHQERNAAERAPARRRSAWRELALRS